MSKLAVVIGGSGFVGRHVVRELAKRGWRVRVGVRRPHLAMHLKPMGVVGQIQLAQVNVRHRASIDQALSGADAVINCVGILFQAGAQKFESVQSVGAANIAAACADAGIANVVHVSAIGADAESESVYARTKAEGEAAMRAAVPDAVVMRPSIVFGPEDDFFNRFAAMTRMAPALPLIGGGKTRFQPVYVDDVADAICEVVGRRTFAATDFELGGPSIYTFRELLELMLREIGVRRALVPVPFFAASAMGIGGQIAGMLPFIDPFLTQDQVRLLKTDNVVNGEDQQIATLATLGITPKSVEAVLPSYMVQYRKHGQFTEDQAA